jgi:hypothetical protein
LIINDIHSNKYCLCFPKIPSKIKCNLSVDFLGFSTLSYLKPVNNPKRNLPTPQATTATRAATTAAISQISAAASAAIIRQKEAASRQQAALQLQAALRQKEAAPRVQALRQQAASDEIFHDAHENFEQAKATTQGRQSTRDMFYDVYGGYLNSTTSEEEQ